VRGLRDIHLLDSPRPELLEPVTGIPTDASGKHAMLKSAGVRSTQRIGLGEVGGGIVVFNWTAPRVLARAGPRPALHEPAAADDGRRVPKLDGRLRAQSG
jgi:hypothetical protein